MKTEKETTLAFISDFCDLLEKHNCEVEAVREEHDYGRSTISLSIAFEYYELDLPSYVYLSNMKELELQLGEK